MSENDALLVRRRSSGSSSKMHSPLMSLAPTRQTLDHWLTLTLMAVLVWACLWSLFGSSALPPNQLFSLLVLFVSAAIAGQLVTLIHLPPLLGMLVAGFVVGNQPWLDFIIDANQSSILRNLALTVILLRAGLGLDPKVLRRLSSVCLRLSFTPCLFEAVTIGFAAFFLLHFPLIWGLLLGFVIAAVSPAVVVPGMLSLQDQKLGVAKGVPTLVMAAASVDDVLAITGFGVMLAMAFDQGSSIWSSLLRGPFEAMVGLAVGCIVGVLLWYVPNKEESDATVKRTALVTLFGVLSLFGSASVDFGGAGALSCLTLAFVAALRWRRIECDQPVEQHLKIFWTFLQPFLFALIGAEVKLANLQGDTIGWALLVLLIGLVVRMLVSAAVVWGAGFTVNEKLFIAFAWLPKATVQAAIGPVALDTARRLNGSVSQVEMATLILTIAVLGIIITAPVGAALMAITGPRLLEKNDHPADGPKEQLEDQTSDGLFQVKAH